MVVNISNEEEIAKRKKDLAIFCHLEKLLKYGHYPIGNLVQEIEKGKFKDGVAVAGNGIPDNKPEMFSLDEIAGIDFEYMAGYAYAAPHKYQPKAWHDYEISVSGI